MTFELGYASGVFDMFHIGHLNLLRRARGHCSHLTVGVASDDYVITAKGRAPVIPFAERFEIVTALAIVDRVVTDQSEDKALIWAQTPFDVIFKGDDWRGTDKGTRLEKSMAALGASVLYFPYTAHTSSRLLRAHLDSNTLIHNQRRMGDATVAEESA